jgi:acetoin utilization protein AcuB
MTDSSVETVMSRGVVTLAPDDTLATASALMVEKGIRHLVILEKGRVVGVLSERDLLQRAFARSVGYTERDRNTLMRSVQAREVVLRAPITTGPETALSEAANLMVEKKIGCLPVVSAGALVGVVTATDLLRHAGAERPQSQPVAHVPGHLR